MMQWRLRVWLCIFCAYVTDETTSRATWKLQQRNVCFEAKGNKFGAFTMKDNGILNSFKIVHKSGYVACHGHGHSNWGCNGASISAVITNSNNGILFPNNVDRRGWFGLPGYTSKSKELIFNNPTYNAKVSKGQDMRLWYGEDLKGYTESDNHGKACVDIYADVQDCPRENGFCVKSDNGDQNSGVIKLNSYDGDSIEAQTKCMQLCLARKGATGCEVIWNQSNRGCYVHTNKDVARGNNIGKHYCWIFSKCKSLFCMANGQQCHHEAVCMGVGNDSYCQCSIGYEGNGTYCKKPTRFTSCGGTIVVSNVQLVYPAVGQYKSNKRCEWNINTGVPIVIRFDKFDLEDHINCSNDYLEIEDDGKLIGKYCGRTIPKTLISGSSDKKVIFRSNSKIFKSGFSFWIGKATCYTIGCHVDAICNTTNDVPICECRTGYWGDGYQRCRRDDACSKKGIYCNDHATCKYQSKKKKHYCSCNSGYKGNGTECSRVSQSESNKTGYIGIAIGIFVCCCFGGRNHHRRKTAMANNTQPQPSTSAPPAPVPIAGEIAHFAGSVWDWYHNGSNKNGEVEFTYDNKVKWSGGAPQGSWRIDGNMVTTRFNNINHQLEFNAATGEAILVVPRRQPASKMIRKDAPEPQPSSSSSSNSNNHTGTHTLPVNSLPDDPKAASSELSNMNDPPPLYQPYVIPTYVEIMSNETDFLPPPPSYEEAIRNM